MKLGILPLFERRAIVDPDWVVEFVRAVEEGGCDSVFTVEHVIVAEDYERLYPYSEDGSMPTGPDTVMPDPLEWLAFAAAQTEHLLLGTGVVIAAQHSAAILAKRVATLDRLSRGRVRLGVGLGWQREEYEAIGVPYADRGRRLDECIEAMRALWGPSPSTYRGKHVSFERVHSDPKPWSSEGVPILIGGSGTLAARRAGRLGNGFFPHVISPDDLATRVSEMHDAARAAGRSDASLPVTVWPSSWQVGSAFDLDLAARYRDAGVSRLLVSAQEAAGPSLDDVRRLIDSVQEQVIAKLG